MNQENWRHGPPWMREGGPPWARHGGRPRHRFIFFRFLFAFGFVLLFLVGGMGALAFLVTRLVGGTGHTAMIVWLAGLALVLRLHFFGIAMGMRAFRNIAVPLGGIMSAADAVADGDLTARALENQRGQFGRLAQSFNHMIEELQRTDQLRKNMTADVAHELRTPLHVIQGNLEGVLDGVYKPAPEHIADTLEETRLLARLVDDLGTLSLAESGQLKLVKEPVNVSEFLADVAEAFKSQAYAAGIAIKLENPESQPQPNVKADAGRMQQVLGNLITNALRHTAKGGTIALRASAAPDGVTLEVADTGEGISPTDLPYSFDRFWRGDKARSQPGAGVGLAIARQLVQAHSGRISATSELGKGTTFTITLPMS